MSRSEGDSKRLIRFSAFASRATGKRRGYPGTPDGTDAGTVRVKDINPGAGSSFSNVGFAVFNGALYFSATDGTSGFELWKTNGTDAGTVRVKDINPAAGSSNPLGLTPF
jgi:ELWxxDGT repeat protein